MGVSGTTAGDFIWYGTTALHKVLFDANGDTNGAVYIGADTKGLMFNLYGDITGCGVFWDPSTDTNGTLTIGATGGSKGNDLRAYGATNGCSMLWDQSEDQLVITGPADVPALKIVGAGSYEMTVHSAFGTAWADTATPAFVADQAYALIDLNGTIYRLPLWANA